MQLKKKCTFTFTVHFFHLFWFAQMTANLGKYPLWKFFFFRKWLMALVFDISSARQNACKWDFLIPHSSNRILVFALFHLQFYLEGSQRKLALCLCLESERLSSFIFSFTYIKNSFYVCLSHSQFLTCHCFATNRKFRCFIKWKHQFGPCLNSSILICCAISMACKQILQQIWIKVYLCSLIQVAKFSSNAGQAMTLISLEHFKKIIFFYFLLPNTLLINIIFPRCSIIPYCHRSF